MISHIEKKTNGKTLNVEVTCKIRKFAIHDIKYLTTDELIDILKEEFKIIKVVSSPKHRVGNTQRGKTKTTGTWIFEIETQKRRATKKQANKSNEEKLTTTSPKKPSIRGRMSKLAQEYEEENIAEQQRTEKNKLL